MLNAPKPICSVGISSNGDTVPLTLLHPRSFCGPSTNVLQAVYSCLLLLGLCLKKSAKFYWNQSHQQDFKQLNYNQPIYLFKTCIVHQITGYSLILYMTNRELNTKKALTHYQTSIMLSWQSMHWLLHNSPLSLMKTFFTPNWCWRVLGPLYSFS